MSKGTMLTRQKYCVLCEYRIKDKQFGTLCVHNDYKPINESMKDCALLEPFEKHRIAKENNS